MHANNTDPYTVLGLMGDADDAAIRTAYHEMVRLGTTTPAVNAAYASIRDEPGRQKVRWLTVPGLLAPLQTESRSAVLDAAALSALVRELAFVSDWELGESDV